MTTRTATRDVPRPGADSNAKRAAKVADLIIEDVMALGWPVGDVLGSETDLLERYQVSRAVFREAVRLVEHQQVAARGAAQVGVSSSLSQRWAP